MNTTKRYVLITGASAGLGEAIAVEFARRGKPLLLVSLPETGLAELSKKIAAEHKVITDYFEVNLTDIDAPDRIRSWTQEKGYQLEALVNNAGMGYSGAFNETQAGFIRTLLQLNNQAATLLTHTFLPDLIAQGNGYLLNIASIAGLQPAPFKSAYSASKAYIVNFTRSLRTELRGSGVSATVVCPGGIYTNEAVKARIAAAGKMGQITAEYPEDVARQAVDGMYRKKDLVITGRANRWFVRFSKLLPYQTKQNMMRNVFIKGEGN